MNYYAENRVGRFLLNYGDIQDYGEFVLKHFDVTEVRPLDGYNSMEYVAYSDLFRPCKISEERLPHYEIRIRHRNTPDMKLEVREVAKEK